MFSTCLKLASQSVRFRELCNLGVRTLKIVRMDINCVVSPKFKIFCAGVFRFNLIDLPQKLKIYTSCITCSERTFYGDQFQSASFNPLDVWSAWKSNQWQNRIAGFVSLSACVRAHHGEKFLASVRGDSVGRRRGLFWWPGSINIALLPPRLLVCLAAQVFTVHSAVRGVG